jgi:hypothetical protein
MGDANGDEKCWLRLGPSTAARARAARRDDHAVRLARGRASGRLRATRRPPPAPFHDASPALPPLAAAHRGRSIPLRAVGWPLVPRISRHVGQYPSRAKMAAATITQVWLASAPRVRELLRARPERDDPRPGSHDLKTQNPVPRALTRHRTESPMSDSFERQLAKIRRATALQPGLHYFT